MKTFLANAFAVGRLATVQEFHLSRSGKLASHLTRPIKVTQGKHRLAYDHSSHPINGPCRQAGFQLRAF
ncbi:unnamed protein product [Dracunculus medinensis]|uniref:Transposase n=1 Tax=Dracunculus medinensis TaxID=318479 RepID=A0A0N4U516_DRAME|nr:unnamed protein product [Dracunculus medinensis]